MIPTPSPPPPIPPTPNLLTLPPFHPIPSLPNFRDIGGWPISHPNSSTPQHVRKSLMFRGSDTTRITPAGIQALVDLGIRTDFDIRNASQVRKLGFRDMSEWGVERVWVPVFVEEDGRAGEEGEKEARRRYELYASEDVNDIVEAFIEILTCGAPMMAVVMRHLIATAQTSSRPPALFMHCTTGNNRTGVFIALLLLLLHVPAQHVVTEYTLSDMGLAPTRHINVSRLLAKGAFMELGEVEAKAKCERMVGARRESIEALLAEVGRRWGGAEGYFLELVGLSEEEVSMIREILTAEGECSSSRWLGEQPVVS